MAEALPNTLSQHIGADTRRFTLHGRLLHDDEFETSDPLTGMTVRVVETVKRFWVWNSDIIRDTVVTGRDGSFTLTGHTFRQLEGGKVRLEIVEYPPEWKERTVESDRQRVRATMEITGAQLQAGNLGEIKHKFWEWQDSGLARVTWEKDETLQPPDFSKEYKKERIREGAGEIFHQRVVAKVLGECNTAQKVQDYHKNLLGNVPLTMVEEAKEKGSTRTGDWMAKRMLQGFSPVHFRRGSRSNEFVYIVDWTRCEMDNVHDLPNCVARFRLNGEKFEITSLTVHFRERTDDGKPLAAGSEMEPTSRSYRPGQSDWEEGLRYFRTAHFVAGQTDHHLGTGHLETEMYAVAARRAFNGIGFIEEMLNPFMREVVNINHEGESVIFGEGSALADSTALTAKSVEQRLKDRLASLDWRGWKPRAPICKDHTYAHAANLYWTLLGEFLDEWIAEHHTALVDHWWAVRKFSLDLFEVSPEYKPWMGVRDVSRWSDPNELIDTEKYPRLWGKLEDGTTIEMATSRITCRAENPEEEDFANLKQVFQYMIFRASFWHMWCNDKQPEDGGEIAYCTMGLKRGEETSAKDATVQLALVNVLAQTKHGLIKDADVPAGLREKILAHRDEFAKYGLDVDMMRARVNI